MAMLHSLVILPSTTARLLLRARCLQDLQSSLTCLQQRPVSVMKDIRTQVGAQRVRMQRMHSPQAWKS